MPNTSKSSRKASTGAARPEFTDAFAALYRDSVANVAELQSRRQNGSPQRKRGSAPFQSLLRSFSSTSPSRRSKPALRLRRAQSTL
jgi:hypothetical protein